MANLVNAACSCTCLNSTQSLEAADEGWEGRPINCFLLSPGMNMSISISRCYAMPCNEKECCEACVVKSFVIVCLSRSSLFRVALACQFSQTVTCFDRMLCQAVSVDEICAVSCQSHYVRIPGTLPPQSRWVLTTICPDQHQRPKDPADIS